jgi:hypothetical protein
MTAARWQPEHITPDVTVYRPVDDDDQPDETKVRDQFVRALKQFLAGVRDDEEDDPYRRYDIRDGIPAFMVRPGDLEGMSGHVGVSSEGWRIQWEAVPPGQKSGTL